MANFFFAWFGALPSVVNPVCGLLLTETKDVVEVPRKLFYTHPPLRAIQKGLALVVRVCNVGYIRSSPPQDGGSVCEFFQI